MPIDRPGAASAIAAFLRAIGQDPDTNPDLLATPNNVTSAFLDELLAGYGVDIDDLIRTGTCAVVAPNQSTLVLVRDLAVSSVCPHHLMPSLGQAAVAYLPGPQLLGLGTLSRLVDAFSQRLTLQEDIARHVVETLMDRVHARGAYCSVVLRHTCLACRGSRQDRAAVLSEARGGVLAEQPHAAHLHTLLMQAGPR